MHLKSASSVQSTVPARSFRRFAVVGVANTVFSLSFFPLFYLATREMLSFDTILILSYVACNAVPFVTHRYITFQSTGSLACEIARYAMVAVVTYGINKILLWLLADRLPFSLFVTQLIISAMLFVPSYLWLSRLVFRDRGRISLR